MRLLVAGVGVFGRDVRAALRDRGVEHDDPSDAMGPDRLVVVIASRPALAVARELDRGGQPFVPVWGHHGRLQVGPVVARHGPCFNCFEARERQHATDLGVHDAIAAHWLRAVVPPPTAAVAALVDLAAQEVADLSAALAAEFTASVPASLAGVVRRHPAPGSGHAVVEGRVIAVHGCSCRKDRR